MRTFLAVAAWLAFGLALVVGGGALGAALAPKANPHNDWGATWLAYVAGGGLAGLAAAVGIALRRLRRE